MSVKRYWISSNGIACEDENGKFVKHEDYAALEQRLADSQREFRAADATIENLQMQLNADREAKLALDGRPMSNIDKQALRDKIQLKREILDTQTVIDIDKLEALLDELEAKDRRLNEILKPDVLLPVIDDMDEDNLRHVIKTVCENYSLLHAKWASAVNRAKAAEKRIAELEGREVKLPKPISVLHRRDFIDAHRSIYAYPEAEVNAALADAGINIAAAGKGE